MQLKMSTVNSLLLGRSCLLVALATCLGGVWTLEQPSGSLLEYYPAWRYVVANIFRCGGPTSVAWFIPWNARHVQKLVYNCCLSGRLNALHGYSLKLTEVQIVRWWMLHYSSKSPKRHWAYGNSAAILSIDRGRLVGWKPAKEERLRTAVRYTDWSGKRRFKGTAALRGTELLNQWNNNVWLTSLFQSGFNKPIPIFVPPILLLCRGYTRCRLPEPSLTWSRR